MKITGTIVNKDMKLIGLVLKGKPSEFGFISSQSKDIVSFNLIEAKKFINKGLIPNFTIDKMGNIVGIGTQKLSQYSMYDKNGKSINNQITIKNIVVDNENNLVGGTVIFHQTGEEKQLKINDLLLLYNYCEATNFTLRVRDKKVYITGKGNTKKEDILVKYINMTPIKKGIVIPVKSNNPNTADEDINTYGCDGCGERIPNNRVFWFTSSIGFCEKCNSRLHKNLSEEEITELYEGCESDDSDAIDAIIDATQK